MFTLIGACSQAQPILHPPLPVAPVGVVRDFGAAHGRTAVLSLAPPSTRLAPGHYGVLKRRAPSTTGWQPTSSSTTCC